MKRMSLGLCALAACQPTPHAPAHVRIVARDYAFAFPPRLPAGLTSFQLVNEGAVRHEVQLYRFKPGISRDSAFRMLAADSIPESAIDIDGGVLIVGPGSSAVQELVAPLHTGDVYALECAFRNAPGEPRHRDIGMISVFEVN